MLKDLQLLVKEGVISEETAERIRDYYGKKNTSPQNKLLIVFSILGAILSGLGIILIIAHNWDEFSPMVRTVFAFIPLLSGQILCGYTLIKKTDSIVWRESGSIFLSLSAGASISLVSQIYNISGNPGNFILTWMLLTLPLIYLMKSSVTSIFYIIGITCYACLQSYWGNDIYKSDWYWLLLLPSLHSFYMLNKNNPRSNFTYIHNWIIPGSIIIALGTVSRNYSYLMYISYMSLFGLFYLIGKSVFKKDRKIISNGFLILGSAGSIILLLILNFDWFWKSLHKKIVLPNELLKAPEFYVLIVISLAAGVMLYKNLKSKPLKEIYPEEVLFLFFIITYIIGIFSPVSALICVNILVLLTGIILVLKGAKVNHLGLMNYGLLVILAEILCRYFDFSLSFVFRGVLFIVAGVCFFLINYSMIKKRKSNVI